MANTTRPAQRAFAHWPVLLLLPKNSRTHGEDELATKGTAFMWTEQRNELFKLKASLSRAPVLGFPHGEVQ